MASPPATTGRTAMTQHDRAESPEADQQVAAASPAAGDVRGGEDEAGEHRTADEEVGHPADQLWSPGEEAGRLHHMSWADKDFEQGVFVPSG